MIRRFTVLLWRSYWSKISILTALRSPRRRKERTPHYLLRGLVVEATANELLSPCSGLRIFSSVRIGGWQDAIAFIDRTVSASRNKVVEIRDKWLVPAAQIEEDILVF